MTAAAALQDTIAPKMAGLSPALRNAADYVIKHADSVAMLSLRRVATDSNMSPATFSRLAKSLDLDSYEALRDLCRHDMRRRVRSFAGKAETLQSHEVSGTGALLKRHAAASVANIEQMVATIDGPELANTADALTRARNVVAFGALSSAPLIEHLVYSARLALPNWRAASAHGSVAITLQDLGPDDFLLVLAQEPCAQSCVRLAEAAEERGSTVVAILDSYASPIAAIADKVLIAPTDSPHFFVSEVATVLLLETLLSMVVQRTGKDAQERIAAIESENHRSGEFWPTRNRTASK